MSNNFSHLLSPMKIGSMTVKNRFVVSAMQPYEVDARGGFTNDGINYYVERAKGGFGMITIGSMYCDTQVDPFSSLLISALTVYPKTSFVPLPL